MGPKIMCFLKKRKHMVLHEEQNKKFFIFFSYKSLAYYKPVQLNLISARQK